MSELLKRVRLKSQRRRPLLARQLGFDSADNLGALLGNFRSPSGSHRCQSYSLANSNITVNTSFSADKNSNSNNSCSSTNNNNNSSVDHEFDASHAMIYTDSSTFLKGTQSSNPHNDYCQHFVDTGQRPQNFIRDVDRDTRFEEYPKLRELVRLKDELVARTAVPPMFLHADLLSYELGRLDCRFDVILVEPPLLEYQRALTGGGARRRHWSWPEVQALHVDTVAAQRSFVFLWCGSSDGVDFGRQCLRAWGFRRCEDICWVKTNKMATTVADSGAAAAAADSRAILRRTKEHCLMGIRGTVRRSSDGDFIHANVDIDLIVSEEPARGSLHKPDELFEIIERFCLGSRRLHLFGSESTLRPGWVTVGPALTASNYDARLYARQVRGARCTTGCTQRIETLRPKSPQPQPPHQLPPSKQQQQQQLPSLKCRAGYGHHRSRALR